MNVSAIWSLLLTTASMQVTLFEMEYKRADLSATLKELEPYFGLPRVDSFDYVIVGGGAAGCVVAGMLSEAGFSVLLVEKGGDPAPPIMSPFLPSVRFDNIANDFYTSLPQRNAALRTGGIITIPCGTMLGGSGSHNSMTHIRGSPEVYDQWAELVGDPSFSYHEMLSVYKGLESMTGFLFNENERETYYGQTGPFSVETDVPPGFGDWFAAGNLLGFKAKDPNAHLETSFTTIHTSTRDGIRETSYTAFIQRRPNPNLTLKRFSVVRKLLIENTTATGVLYLRHGIPQIALSKKEVVLTAGPLVSPLLLLLSGIGPATLLSEAGIPCVKDLPGVGARIEHHNSVPLTFTLRNPNLLVPDDKRILSFLTKHPGGTGATGGIGLLAFLRSSISPETGPWPDLRIKFQQDPINVKMVSVQVELTRTKSQGFIWFNASAIRNGEFESTKILHPNPAVFERKEDLAALKEGLDFFFNGILNTPKYQAMEFTYSGKLNEGCESFRPNSAEFWACFAKREALAGAYMTSGCRMGSAEDVMRVIDNHFRVVGVNKLRVADSSSMPKISNADMHAPTLALAAKAAKDIIFFPNT